ncbi:hypothetical protein, partial [Catellatospora sp. NPDC049609]|uniref:hypothetical protein n=1 Tax=Catellatospora sp. NPDC049609 TaxID=3155505 RepID=UPI00344607CE
MRPRTAAALVGTLALLVLGFSGAGAAAAAAESAMASPKDMSSVVDNFWGGLATYSVMSRGPSRYAGSSS